MGLASAGPASSTAASAAPVVAVVASAAVRRSRVKVGIVVISSVAVGRSWADRGLPTDARLLADVR
ncbi:MAG: hypothetical protein BGO26_08495 [Actinobacteria bacterium 69-20]|nr:MAG: hypothetical protein BGO26_08495 [Actinobacteria bacterium 69-20]